MALATSVIARLKSQVTAFSNRVEGAADLTKLVNAGNLPQVTPAAHVVPAGLTGGKAHAITLAFDQMVTRQISVIVSFRQRDKTSTRGLDDVEDLLNETILALLGWTPDDANTTGVFELRGVRLLSIAGDALVYQIDFTLPDHLRIT